MEQEVIVGINGLERAAGIVHLKSFQKILVVTGNHQDELKKDQFKIKDKETIIISPPAGLLSFVNIQPFINDLPWLPDAVIAIGGGRIMDAAKLILYKLAGTRPFFIAIPTTAGSGSEATTFAVVYEGIKKTSLAHSSLLPDVVLLDPSLLTSLSSSQRAISGIDAFAQAIESIWNIHATETSITYAVKALEILWADIVSFVHHNDVERNKRVQWAAYLSGKAIAITKTTGCHALSYYLTANHHVPHGQAVAFFLPSFFIYNDVGEAGERLKMIYKILGVENGKEAFFAIKKMMVACGLATTFSEMGIEVNIDGLINSANQERFSNNPAPFSRSALKELIKQYIV